MKTELKENIIDDVTVNKIITKAREIIKDITTELKSEHIDKTKAINVTFNEGIIFGLLEVLRIGNRFQEYCTVATEMKINEPLADEIKNKIYKNF